MNSIVERIRKTLRENIDENTLANSQRFFKESVKCYGVRMPECTKIARQFWPEVQRFKKSEIFELCELLLVSDYCEEVYIISSWLPKMVEQFDKDDLVQKGYGWMLKAASEAYQKEVYEYVLQNKEKMPRTSLRYAIEKMPDWMKKEAIKR